MELAEAEVRAVPSVHKAKVPAWKAPGAIAYPAIDVKTTKPTIDIRVECFIFSCHTQRIYSITD